MTHILTQIHDDGNITRREGFDFLTFLMTDKEKGDFVRKIYLHEKTRLMWNRLKWFVELADSQNYDSVKVFFLIALAEANIKLLGDRFDHTDKQVDDVKRFFNFFSVEDRQFLESKFLFPLVYGEIQQKVTFKNIVEILLNVRHKVVHGKNHYQFIFNNCRTEGELNKQKFPYDLQMNYDEFRTIIIKYATLNIKNIL